MFTEVNALSKGNGTEITAAQFAIRVTEHQQTAAELVRAVLRSAGISPSTLGEQEPGAAAMTATEVTDRQQASTRTRSKKALYWSSGLSSITAALLDVDRLLGNGPGLDLNERPAVEFAPRSQPDPQALAATVETLHRAESASLDVRVRMVHPDWDDADVTAEVRRIRDESGAIEPDPAEILRDAAAEPSFRTSVRS